MMYYQYPQKKKFSNKTTYYNNVWYQSIKEADYAQELDLRIKAKDLKEWKRQVPIDMVVNGMKICTYKIDFVEIDHNDNEVWTEVKGFETPEWRLKWKLFEALYPERDKKVIK